MIGISATTGKHLSDLKHLHQSVRDILTTPIGTRVMRREYGSELPDLVDSPIHPDRFIEFYAATIIALERWEPRLRTLSVQVQAVTEGVLTLKLDAVYLPNGEEITIEGIEIT